MTDVNAELTKVLPRLRIYALSLTRDRTQADDLVQEVALKTLSHADKFQAGTNFAAWSFRIMRNEFISGIRRRRHTSAIEDLPEGTFSRPATQGVRDLEKDFMQRMRLLPLEQRQALVLANVEGMDYEAMASHTGVSVGTVKSRISRARAMMAGVL